MRIKFDISSLASAQFPHMLLDLVAENDTNVSMDMKGLEFASNFHPYPLKL
jgi:hypothetical protein